MKDETTSETIDYTSYLTQIIENQQAEITELKAQTAYQQEQLNGIAAMASYQLTGISFSVVAVLIVVVWKIMNNWFFRSM